MLLTILSSALLCLGSVDAKLNGAEEREWRELVTRAVVEGESKELLTSAAAFERFAVGELVGSARKGPLYVPKASEPRMVDGAMEVFETFGRTVSGYSFVVDGHVYRYAVNLPRKYDPKQAWPLLLDPGHGSASGEGAAVKADMLEFYRTLADEAGGRDWIVIRTEIIEQVGPGGLFEKKPEDEVVAIFDAFFRDVFRRFHVDLSEVRVTGISQTGFWSWYLAAARPCRFAGLAPAASVSWQIQQNLENLRNLSIFVAHGDKDPKCPVEQSRVSVRRLANLGARVHYVEVEGGEHNGAVFREIQGGLTFLREHPREPYPKQLSKACANLAEGGWAYWLRIDELDREDQGNASLDRPAMGGVDAVIDGQTIHLHSEGVQRVTLGLSPEMLDLDEPIQVIWNGKLVHEAQVERSVGALLELIADKADWIGLFEAKLELKAPKR